MQVIVGASEVRSNHRVLSLASNFIRIRSGDLNYSASPALQTKRRSGARHPRPHAHGWPTTGCRSPLRRLRPRPPTYFPPGWSPTFQVSTSDAATGVLSRPGAAAAAAADLALRDESAAAWDSGLHGATGTDPVSPARFSPCYTAANKIMNVAATKIIRWWRGSCGVYLDRRWAGSVIADWWLRLHAKRTAQCHLIYAHRSWSEESLRPVERAPHRA